MKYNLNFTPFERKINLLILLIFILLLLLFYLSTIYTSPILNILKTALEASLVGALADSYAVFGLFHRLGPHTNLLLRKRQELTDRVVHFVSSFLFDKEVLKKELERLDLTQIILNVDREKLIPFLEENLRKLFEEFIEVTLRGKDWRYRLNKFNYPIILKMESIIDLIVEKIAEFLREALKEWLKDYLNERIPEFVAILTQKLENDPELREKIKELIYEEIINFVERNHNLIEEIARKRLEEIDDSEYLLLLKRATWDELQWIRLNGTLLGFLIGFFIGLFEWLLLN